MNCIFYNKLIGCLNQKTQSTTNQQNDIVHTKNRLARDAITKRHQLIALSLPPNENRGR